MVAMKGHALLSLMAFVIYFASVSSVELASDQIPILTEIYQFLGPTDPSVLPSWSKNSSTCETWEGLTCNAQGKVTEIYLSTQYTLFLNGTTRSPNLNSLQLGFGTFLFVGIISPAIGSLTNLESITLASLGEVSGVLPTSLGNLPNLSFLNCSGNIIFGPIPASLVSATKLQVIDLHANAYYSRQGVLLSAMNGTIPSTLANLNLKIFDISQNAFNDSVPAFFKDQLELSYLSLAENQFTGSIGSFLPVSTNLAYLNLGLNNFSGPFDPVIGQLTSLQYLDLETNKFSGAVPDFIANLTSLQTLNLNGNNFTSLPNTFGGLHQLEYLNLAVNFIDGPFPESFGNLTSLKSLQVQQNGLSGPFDISALTKLTYLDISYNNLSLSTGIPDYFGNFTNLKSLILDYNNFAGPIPSSLGNILNLTVLSCTSCGLTGSIPDGISQRSTLQQLRLPSNFLVGNIPSSLCRIQTLVILDLSGNALNGSIPPCLATNITTFDTLWLYNNSLTGPIPEALGTLPCLSNLQLQSNGLEGQIPALGTGPGCVYFGFLSPSNTVLSTLDLSNNTLTGIPFPAAITNLTALSTLSLSFNQFGGDSLTDGIGNLTSLSTFRCRSCNLVGTIPLEIGKLTNLQNLDLSFNSFTGFLQPNFFANFTFINSISISGSSLSGSIPSISSLTALSNLDLSFNQFSSVLPSKLPESLVSLNLAGNHLSGILTSTYFSLLPALNIIQLDGNIGISGSIPVVNASILSLVNTNVSGPIPASLLKENSSKISLFNTPACQGNVSQNYSSVCAGIVSTNVYTAQPACTPSVACLGTNLPNPFLLSSSQSCVCAGYVATSLTLLLSPFSVLTKPAASILETTLSESLNIAPSRLWVQSATTYHDGRTVINLLIFGSSEQSVSGSFLSRFFFIWSPTVLGQSHFLTVTGLGLIDTPNSVEVFEFVPTPLPIIGAFGASSSSSNSIAIAWIIVLAVVGGILLFSVAGLILFIALRKGPKENTDGVIPRKPYYVPRIPLEAIAAATGNFSEENKIGSGGFGDVYKGKGADGTAWAVKRAKSVTEASLAEFEQELDILSKVSHSNVVKLLGYCDTRSEQVLVYEFMNGGNLMDKLSFHPDEPSRNPMTLLERVEVALGAAEGLRYLHSHAEKTIIHRDIKSDNILINVMASGLQAKIADFGLLKENADNVAEFMNTRVAGTTGYIDPEYYSNFKVTRKSDVYSFGVVMLELITGLSAIVRDDSVSDADEPNITSLVNWVQPLLDDVSKMVDPRIDPGCDKEALEQFAKLAKSCTERFGKYRPFMDEVCVRLLRIKNLLAGTADETQGEDTNSMGSRTPSFSMRLPSFSHVSSVQSQSLIMAPTSQNYVQLR